MCLDRIAIWLFVLIVPAGVVMAQARPRPHAFAPVVSLIYQFNRDEKASPLVYSGIYPDVGFRYRYLGAKARHRVNLQYGRTVLTSDITKGDMSRQRGDDLLLDVEHAFRIARSGPASLYVGGRVENRYNFRYHRYTNRTTEYVGLNNTSLALLVMAVRPVTSTTELTAAASGVVLSYVMRTPYSVKGPVEGTVQSPRDFRSLSALLGVDQRIGKRFMLSTGYTIQLARLEERWPVGMIYHQAELALAVRF